MSGVKLGFSHQTKRVAHGGSEPKLKQMYRLVKE